MSGRECWICKLVGLRNQRLRESPGGECELAMLCADVDVPVNIILFQSLLIFVIA